MHTEVLGGIRGYLLADLASLIPCSGSYLAGGTALSLQTGWRESFDFDFFTPTDFNPSWLLQRLRTLPYPVTPVNVTGGTCDVDVAGVQVSYFYYPYPTYALVNGAPDFPGLRLAGVDDIACMKAIAIAQRGSRKDFYDLYNILREFGHSPETLVDLLVGKFGSTDMLSNVGMALSYFEDAEREVLPKTFVPEDWDAEKGFFRDYGIRFLEAALRRPGNVGGDPEL